MGSLLARPVRLQLGVGLTRSAPSSLQKLIHVEHGSSLKHVVNGTTQLMGQDGERFALAVLSLQFVEKALASGVMPQEQPLLRKPT